MKCINILFCASLLTACNYVSSNSNLASKEEIAGLVTDYCQPVIPLQVLGVSTDYMAKSGRFNEVKSGIVAIYKQNDSTYYIYSIHNISELLSCSYGKIFDNIENKIVIYYDLSLFYNRRSSTTDSTIKSLKHYMLQCYLQRGPAGWKG